MNTFKVGETVQYFMEPDDKGLTGNGWIDCEIVGGSYDDGYGEAYKIRIEGDTQDWKVVIKDLRKKQDD